MPKAKRGEVWLADLGLAAKVRPVLIVNVEFQDDERALYAIVPHTTALRGGRFEVPVDVRWLAAGAFDVQGTRPAPPPALIRKLGVLDPKRLEAVDEALRRWFGVPR
jgi:mRNA interferase MazF